MISLEPQTERFPICGRCAKPNLLTHEQQHIRQVRDRDLQDQRVLLQLPVRRVDCLYCGRVSERIDCLAPASRLPRNAACNTSLADLSGGVNRRRAKPCRSQLAGEWRMFARKLAPTERVPAIRRSTRLSPRFRDDPFLLGAVLTQAPGRPGE
nr:transposase family protein [Pseudomonas boanensis]